MEVLATLPDLVREHRARNGLSLRDAAAQIGDVSFSTLRTIELGSPTTLTHARSVLAWLLRYS